MLSNNSLSIRFEILLTDGTYYDIYHPGQVFLTRRSCYAGIGRNGHEVYEHSAIVSNIHTTQIIPLKSKKSSR